MREWLSGGAPPCQGGGRGFDPRLALGKNKRYRKISLIFFEHILCSKFDCLRCRSGPRITEVHRTSCAVSRSR